MIETTLMDIWNKVGAQEGGIFYQGSAIAVAALFLFLVAYTLASSLIAALHGFATRGDAPAHSQAMAQIEIARAKAQADKDVAFHNWAAQRDVAYYGYLSQRDAAYYKAQTEITLNAQPSYPARPTFRTQYTAPRDIHKQPAERVTQNSNGHLHIEIAGVPRDLEPGFVYVIKGMAQYKIGKARNIQDRLKQLSTGHESKLSVVHSIPSNAMGKAEAMLHAHFANKRGQGEWFNLDELDLNYLKSIARMDIPDPSGTPRTPQSHPSTNGATPTATPTT